MRQCNNFSYKRRKKGRKKKQGRYLERRGSPKEIKKKLDSKMKDAMGKKRVLLRVHICTYVI